MLRLPSAGMIAVLVGGAAWALEVDRTFRSFAQGDATGLRIEVPVGDVTIYPHPRRNVDAELVLDCTGSLGPCRDVARAVRFDSRREEATQILAFSGPAKYDQKARTWLTLASTSRTTNWKGEVREKQKIRGKPKIGWRLAAKLTVGCPKYESLEVLIHDGTLVFHNIESSTNIRIDRGTASLSLQRNAVSTLSVRTGKGSSTILGAGNRPLRGRKLDWQDGSGSAHVIVEIAAGSAQIQIH